MDTPTDPQPTLRQRFLGSAAWTGSSRVLISALGLLVTAVLARLLDPKDFGLLAMATVFSGLAHQTQFFGSEQALIQRTRISPENKAAAFSIALVSSLVVYLILFLTADPISWLYKDDRVAPVLRVIALAFPIGAFTVVPRAMLRRSLRLRGEALTTLVAMISDSAVTITMAWLGFGTWALVTGKLVAAVVAVIGLSLASPWRPKLGFRGGDVRSLLRFGGGVSASAYMWYGYSNFDLMIVGRSLGSSALGIYSMAAHIAKMPMERIWAAMLPLLLPLYARAKEEPRELGRVLCRMTRYNALIMFPLTAGMGAVAGDAVAVLLGEKWVAVVTPLRFLCFYVMTRSVLALLPPALLALGRVKRLLAFHAVCLLVLPAGFAVGLSWGPAGVAFAWAAAYPILALILLLPPTLRAVGVRFGMYWGSLVRPAVAVSLMVAAVTLAGMLPLQGFSRLLVRIVIGGAVYVTSIRMLEGPILEEIRMLLRDAKKGA